MIGMETSNEQTKKTLSPLEECLRITDEIIENQSLSNEKLLNIGVIVFGLSDSKKDIQGDEDKKELEPKGKIQILNNMLKILRCKQLVNIDIIDDINKEI